MKVEKCFIFLLSEGFFSPNDSLHGVFWDSGRSRAAHFIPWLSLVARAQKRRRLYSCSVAELQLHLQTDSVTAPRSWVLGCWHPTAESSKAVGSPLRCASCTDWSSHRSNRQMQSIILLARCANGGIKPETGVLMVLQSCKALRVKKRKWAVLDEAIWSPPEVKTPDGLSITLHN